MSNGERGQYVTELLASAQALLDHLAPKTMEVEPGVFVLVADVCGSHGEWCLPARRLRSAITTIREAEGIT